MSLLTDPKSGRYVERFDYGIFASASGYDGKFSWAEDKSGGSHRLDADFAKRLAISDAWLASRGWCARHGIEAKVTRLPSVARDRDRSVAWRVVPAGGAPIELRFNRASGLLEQSIEQLSESRLIRDYQDWRRVSKGPWLAFAERRSFPEDESTTLVQTARAELVTRTSANSFTMPPLPDDHSIAGGRSTAVSYEDDDRTRVYIPVSINGSGPFLFELDSGGHLILTSETAAALDMTGVGHLSSNGSHGVMKAGFVRLDELRIGSAVLQNQVAKILPLSASSSDRGEKSPRAGIIGLELFERFVVSIDRRSKTVTLSMPRPDETYGGIPLDLSFVEDAPFIDAGFAGKRGPFMLDSGNAGRTVIEHVWAASRGLVPRLQDGVKVGSGIFRCEPLEVGPFNLAHEIIGYYGPASSGSESTHFAAGIFGEPLLSRFNATYDYSNRKIWLQPVPAIGTKPFDRSGLVVTKEPGQPLVIDQLVPSSPAALANLAPGDRIIAINGEDAAQISRSDALLALSASQASVELKVEHRTGDVESVKLRLQDLLPCSDPGSAR